MIDFWQIVEKVKWIILYRRILTAIKVNRRATRKKVNFNALPDGDDKMARFIGLTILLRCTGTIKLMEKMIAKGFIREAMALLKIVQEDTAVAYVHFKKKLNKISDLNPTKCITELKEEIPDTGKHYGWQNIISHYDYELMQNSVYFSQKKGRSGRMHILLSFDWPKLKAKFAGISFFNLHTCYWSVLDLLASTSDAHLKYWVVRENGSRIHRLPRNILVKFIAWGDKMNLAEDTES